MIEPVAAEYNLGSNFKATPLENAGGFGGSSIWKIESGGICFCLKRWPANFSDPSRIEWIHRVLIFAHANGCPELVLPIENKSAKTFVKHDNKYWELNRWVDGQPASRAPLNETQIKSAVRFLARFHQATARYHLNFAPSNNLTLIRNRLFQIDEELEQIDESIELQSIIPMEDWTAYKQYAPLLARDISRFVFPYSESRMPVQPVVRDIRDEHLYFENDKLSAVIDFGAMRIDSVSCDLSRMLGSFFADEAKRIHDGLDDYSAIRQLSHVEREIVMPMNHAAVILGIINWLNWLLIEKRKFDSMEVVKSRIQNLFARFRSYL